MSLDREVGTSEDLLVSALQARSRFVRLEAARALKGARSEAAVAALLRGLDDWYAPVRAACADALAGNKSSDVVYALSQGMRDDKREVRRACAGALEECLGLAA
jgi:HEAT repeat protein